MSFQNFRLGELAMGQPLPAHLIHQQVPVQSSPNNSTQNHESPQFTAQLQNNNSLAAQGHHTANSSSATKPPYGSGDSDDGYTLVFPNLEAFNEWRAREEETKMVEFVKGDTHGSKAVPPRFKDHTKLVCARHSRSGRKKYVKKHPERIRKVPSRKLEGQGCNASISYKTYFDTDEVRACYVSQHTHDIGLANLPFTRRGRKQAVQQEKDRTKRMQKAIGNPNNTCGSTTPSPSATSATALANPAAMHSPESQFTSSVSMLAPLPNPYHQAPTNPYAAQTFQTPTFSAPVPPSDRPSGLSIAHDRWERMAVLFHSIRDHARGFEYPGPSVAALESVLIRLYLESPVGVSAPPLTSYSGVMGGPMMPNGSLGQVGDGQNVPNDVGPNGNGMNGVGTPGMGVDEVVQHSR